MARFDLEKLAEELAAKVRPDFEREIETARADGYRAGIEAAAKAIERQEWVEPTIQAAYARVVRALSAPAAPKAPERGACPACLGKGNHLINAHGDTARCLMCDGTGEPNREAGGDDE